MHQRLTNQHTQDKRTALEQVQSQKDREMEASKMGWQEQIGQLTSLVSNAQFPNWVDLKALCNFVSGISKEASKGAQHALSQYM